MSPSPVNSVQSCRILLFIRMGIPLSVLKQTPSGKRSMLSFMDLVVIISLLFLYRNNHWKIPVRTETASTESTKPAGPWPATRARGVPFFPVVITTVTSLTACKKRICTERNRKVKASIFLERRNEQALTNIHAEAVTRSICTIPAKVCIFPDNIPYSILQAPPTGIRTYT